ncbi:hypothetical protein GB928_020545 [Shinella curvata]|uniref:Uncharacterized protein n=1 Tax=Shinella curvata TaxID=1817964 RepID=A0ABT8XK79_9HYPH|nr:hypothetical protein [Shinella curvata]MCJ8052510.1 hypothetical protein [Shinella curvata]MDO6123590.1 hypothetical protein [Shinella curvata]
MTKIDARNTPPPSSPDKSKIETDAKPETEEEKIKREQATKPALMPIGDPSGAA